MMSHMTDSQKVLVSGVKPTGRPHIGNYFGAIKQIVELQETNKSYVFIADLHALTTVQNAAELNRDSINIAIDYIALGIDPKKTVIFRQSDVSEHAELTWIFNCITTVPYLMRAHAFKDAEAKGKEVNVGVFDYPLLMAADILLYQANIVPVGLDQKQHLEITRDTADKFNRVFGESFRLPDPLILKETGVIPGTDGQKMSKSYNNTIGIFATDEEIKEGVMKIPTDSKSVDEPKDPETCKVFQLHKFVTPKNELDELEKRYRKGGIGYKESKDILIESLKKFITPFRERREEIAKNEGKVIKVLEKGAAEAKKVAGKTMESVREKVGFSI